MSEELRARLSDIFDVDPAQVLPLRSALHAKELAMRLAARGGWKVACSAGGKIDRLAEIYGVERAEGGEIAIREFDEEEIAAPFVLVDESGIEYSSRFSSIGGPGIAVIKELSGLYEAPCAALIAPADLIDWFASVLEPDAMPAIIVKAALEALAPQRLATARARIERTKSERRRLAEKLSSSSYVAAARESERAAICVTPKDDAAFQASMRAFAIKAEPSANGDYVMAVGKPAENDRLLSALGLSEILRRTGEARRETLETKIAALVDLDSGGTIEISTGVGFFDHMLTQIAHHAGISMTLVCEGDLEVDAHHTIEDCAIAFGEALSQALGDRRGIARFGFLLPMDEAEAKVSVDLGGRPYLVFNAAFKLPMIGEYPTEMTAHVFRSLSQSLNAAIHLDATGENDHHKTEACYKAFGRALRQALRIEGEATPSTKGVI